MYHPILIHYKLYFEFKLMLLYFAGILYLFSIVVNDINTSFEFSVCH